MAKRRYEVVASMSREEEHTCVSSVTTLSTGIAARKKCGLEVRTIAETTFDIAESYGRLAESAAQRGGGRESREGLNKALRAGANIDIAAAGVSAGVLESLLV